VGRSHRIGRIVAVVIGLSIVAGCGRSGLPQPVDATQAPQTGRTVEAEKEKKKDKPFLLDFLI
jgi:predicted small lipoprotein YifL